MGGGRHEGREHWRRVLLVEALVVTVLLVPLLALAASPAAADSGPWGWPLSGSPELGRDFAPPASRYGTGHRGVDLVGEPGGAVSAAGAGRVSYAGLLAGRGVVVVVHGALRTTYEPVSAAVSVGDLVELGQPIGSLQAGHPGCPAPACLHWGLRRGEDYLDPVGLVLRRPARLLPLGLSSQPDAGGRVLTPVSAVAGGSRSGGSRSTVAAAPRSRGVGSPVGVPPGEGPARSSPWDAAPVVVDPDPVPRAAVSPGPTVQEEVRLIGGSPADVPLGLLAAAALIAGIGLLTGRRPRPSGPAAAAAAPAPVGSAEGESAQAPVVELASERLRRRSAS